MIHAHAVLDVAVDSATSLAHNDTIDVKTFLFTFFYFGHVFTFFSFSKRFYLKKTLAYFTAASRLTRSTVKVTATK